MRNFIGMRTLKTAVGATLAIIISNALGLKYAASAGIIVVLSIQNTKKTSILLAVQRFGSTILALFIAGFLFTIIGYNPFAFGLYLMVLIPLAVRFKIADGIVVSSVLVTHLLVEKSISPYWIKNELLLMLVGIGIGILFNIYMPKISKEIKEEQIYIEDKMIEILAHMAKTLRSQAVYIGEEKLFKDLKERLDLGSEKAYRNLDNYVNDEAKYYVKYMEMRSLQFEILEYMRGSFSRLYMTFEQTELVADFTEKVALNLHENNTAEELLKELEEIFEVFKLQSLPKTREEFENRATLFQFLKDLEYLLEVKRNFALKI